MADYRLISTWRLDAPLQRVFDAITDSLQWPQWWPGADGVEQMANGDSDGIGCQRHYVWKGRLPYRLGFVACVTRVEPLRLLEATVSGDLEGIGRWTFSEERGVTIVRHEWYVRTTRSWMNAVAPFTRTLFENNHHALMREGAHGLAQRLDARLIEADSSALPAGEAGIQACSAPLSLRLSSGRTVNWTAGVIAGVVGGTVATAVQLALWWSASYPPLGMLLRDARLAAAIILGNSVLPPPASFDWAVMLAASALHLVLSIAYGLLLAPLAACLKRWVALLAGTAFGLLIYAVNMYGFTLLFPWFEASRDWITAVAHATFGASGAATYIFWVARSAHPNNAARQGKG
jgi:uncharacterized protein YndB with AHSA1/START domain